MEGPIPELLGELALTAPSVPTQGWAGGSGWGGRGRTKSIWAENSFQVSTSPTREAATWLSPCCNNSYALPVLGGCFSVLTFHQRHGKSIGFFLSSSNSPDKHPQPSRAPGLKSPVQGCASCCSASLERALSGEIVSAVSQNPAFLKPCCSP